MRNHIISNKFSISVFMHSVIFVALLFGITVYVSSADFIKVENFSLIDNNDRVWELSENPAPAKVIMFWATWCRYCQKLFPSIQALHEQYEKDGVQVIAISIYDEGDTVAYAKKNGLTMTILRGGDEIAQRLNIPATPSVLVLDDKNQIVFGAVNPKPSENEVENSVRKLLDIPIEQI
ncbi:MAG: redoxin domain-containing protein [Pseudomonadales bacterium]|nr:redoxin domain-containing protein [Pseudomonadales bacterium]